MCKKDQLPHILMLKDNQRVGQIEWMTPEESEIRNKWLEQYGSKNIKWVCTYTPEEVDKEAS